MVRFLSPYSSGAQPGESNKPVYPTVLFLTFLILFIAVSACYLIVKYWYNPYLNAQIDKQNEELVKLSSKLSEQDREDLMDFYSRINNIKHLLGDHIYISNFLSKLESLTHSRAAFSNLRINYKQRIARLEGMALDSNSLVEQLLAFEQDSLFSSVRVSRVFLNNSGFNFDAEIVYKPKLLMFNQ